MVNTNTNSQSLSKGHLTIREVQAYQTRCQHLGLKLVGAMHCFATLKLSDGSWCKIDRGASDFIIEENYTRKSSEGIKVYLPTIIPGKSTTLENLRKSVNMLFSGYNIVVNNCFDFIQEVMNQLGCGQQPIKYVRMAAAETVSWVPLRNLDLVGCIYKIVRCAHKLWKRRKIVQSVFQYLMVLLKKLSSIKGIYGILNAPQAALLDSLAVTLTKQLGTVCKITVVASIVGELIGQGLSLYRDYENGQSISIERIGLMLARITGGVVGSAAGWVVGVQVGAFVGSIAGPIGGFVGGAISNWGNRRFNRWIVLWQRDCNSSLGLGFFLVLKIVIEYVILFNNSQIY